MSALIKLPGLFDCHVHFRTPGQEYKEDWKTGSAAALSGGVSGVVDMPCNVPPVLTVEDLRRKREIIEAQNPNIEYRLPIGVTDASVVDALAAQNEACAFKVFLQPHSTGMYVARDETLHTLFSGANKIIMVHDASGVDRILQYVRQYHKATYFCHVSTATEVAALRQAKAENLPVFSEATLHHLFLDQSNQTLGRRAKVNPPLRAPADRAALWQGIRDGIIDVIATDHAPHLLSEKDSPTGAAGFPAIEFFAPLLFTALAQGKISLEDIIRCCYTNPMKLFGFTHPQPVIIDPTLEWTIQPTYIKSKCDWSPYVGLKVQGKVIALE